jgi:hypothetical protein
MAVKVIFDLFLLYGLQTFQLEENGEDEEHGMLGTCSIFYVGTELTIKGFYDCYSTLC